MGRITDTRIKDIQGVAAGQTMTVKLPIGLTYHGVQIPYSGVTLSELKNIEVVANGDVIHRWKDGVELDRINQFDGREPANGLLMVPFDRFGLITRQAREVTALGTGLPPGPESEGRDPNKVTSLLIQAEIDSGATGPSIPHVTAFRSSPRPSGDIIRTKRPVYNVGSATDFVISDLPVFGEIINRIHVHDGGIVDRIVIERDGTKLFERTRAENERLQKDGQTTEGGRVPQSNMITFDTTENGYGGDTLNLGGAQDFRVTLETNNSGQVPISVETIDRVRK